MHQRSAPPDGRLDFIQRVLIVFAFVVLAYLLWRTVDLLLLVFGAALVAILFKSMAEPLNRHVGLPQGLALALSVLIVFGILGIAAWMFGAEVSAQIRTLADLLPDAWRSLEQRLEGGWLGERIRQWMSEASPSGSGLLASASSFALSFGNSLANVLVVLAGGIYLAAQPGLYRTGLLKLVPPARRNLAAEALDDTGRALRRWLLGQLVSMAIIGLLTGIGLWIIGVPSALTLGLLAGLLEFIPIVGPIAAAVPALLLALAQGTETSLLTLGLYLLIQQIEGNLVQPLIQQQTVSLPPALLLFSVIAAGLVFGGLGVILAAPLTVTFYVLVKRLYVREALNTETSMPATEK